MSNNKTPLRYPGGKQRISAFIAEVLNENNINQNYIEPYAGGAGVAIIMLLTGKVSNIYLNDSDRGIYAFWFSILNYTNEFCNLIRTVPLNILEWRRQQRIAKAGDLSNIFELGFSIFYLNRCNRSGVLSGGLIGGLMQSGKYKMDARFPRLQLIQRIEVIAKFKNGIHLTCLDAEEFLSKCVPILSNNSLVYLDPPYYVKGSSLYLNSYKKADHLRISKLIKTELSCKWMLSYDGVDDIRSLYSDKRNFLYSLQYNAAKVYMGKEIFIFSDNLRLPHSSSLPNINLGIQELLLPPFIY